MAADLPPHRTRRISLTKTQLRTELGAELLSLCQTVTADGSLTEQEVQDLRTWLDDSAEADLPAASYLREVVGRIIADGKVTPVEVHELHRAVESVLPQDLRRQAADARKSLEQQARAEARAARERERAEAARNRPVHSINFMVAGCRYEGRPRVIERYANPGNAVALVRDPGNRYSCNAIKVCLQSGQQIGFVPEEDAREWAPDMDQRARTEAHITKILSGGRSPIPVVQAYLYAADSAAAVEESRAFSGHAAPPSRHPAGLYWLTLIIVAALIVVFFASRG